MIKYFKMKKMEIKLKLALYSFINDIVTEKEGAFKICKDLYDSIKDTPSEELQDQFVNSLVNIIHEKANED
jgi:hypothetical protein|nr:MAG TPA: hypothetical protein [Caudoviricetes sp.]